MQGTWCDAQFVQAVADCQNVAIHITESHENIAGETLIGPHYLAQHPSTTIYLFNISIFGPLPLGIIFLPLQIICTCTFLQDVLSRQMIICF